MVRGWPHGWIGPALATIGTVCAAAHAFAEVEPMIQAQVGLVEFRVPKEFVSEWVRSRQHLAVQFSYPQIEPLGRFRFGDENRDKWDDYVQGLIKRGGHVLYVTVDRIQNPKPLPAIVELERMVGAMCKILGIEKFDSYSELEIDFFRCRSGSDAIAQIGHHRVSGWSFIWSNQTNDWRASKRNLDERVLTAVRLRREDLRDWKSITMRAYATVDSWRK